MDLDQLEENLNQLHLQKREEVSPFLYEKVLYKASLKINEEGSTSFKLVVSCAFLILLVLNVAVILPLNFNKKAQNPNLVEQLNLSTNHHLYNEK